ncbi:MAG: VWA domain-containing protein, partial [Pyrinomonadaceae bacterium]
MLFLLFFFATTLAQISPQRGQENQSNNEELIVNTELVVVDVEVKNKNIGRNLGQLKKEDFSIYEDGVKQKITHFSQDKLPLSIVLLLDTSGSVQPIIQHIHDGAVQALQRLKPEDEVALLAFATRTKLIQDFTRDRQTVTDAIEKIKETEGLGGGTFLDEGIYQAAQHLHKSSNPSSRRIIIAITDNISSKGFLLLDGHSGAEALSEVFESGAIVSGLVVGSWLSTTTNIMNTVFVWQKLLLSTSIENYTNKTGGEVMRADKESIETKLSELIDNLRTRYALGYMPSNQKWDGKFRRIKVIVSPEVEKREGKLVILTKRGYYGRHNDTVNHLLKNPAQA